MNFSRSREHSDTCNLWRDDQLSIPTTCHFSLENGVRALKGCATNGGRGCRSQWLQYREFALRTSSEELDCTKLIHSLLRKVVQFPWGNIPSFLERDAKFRESLWAYKIRKCSGYFPWTNIIPPTFFPPYYSFLPTPPPGSPLSLPLASQELQPLRSVLAQIAHRITCKWLVA